MSMLDEAVARLGGGPRAQEVREPVAWRRVSAVGNAGFSPGAAPEVEEMGALPVARLQAEGWPVPDGLAFVDFVPVLPLVGELVEPETRRLFSSAWPSAFYDLLICLPAAEHLPRGIGGTWVSRIAGDTWWLLSFDAGPFEEGPTEPVCVGGRRSGDEVIGALSGGADATGEVARLLGLPADVLQDAVREVQVCPRPW